MEEIGDFANVSRLHACGTQIVATDTDAGEIIWIDPETGHILERAPVDASVVTCHQDRVWLGNTEGWVWRVDPPT